MSIMDLPAISNSAYSNSVYNGTSASMIGGFVPTTTAGTAVDSLFTNQVPPNTRGVVFKSNNVIHRPLVQSNQEDHMADPKRRIVKVIVIDPDDKVPLDRCTLYSGEEKLTDLTDQELFFEIDIRKALDDHNKFRETSINKTVKERTEYLEPIKIRDLRMVVVTVAQF